MHNVITDRYSPRTRDNAVRGVLTWRPTSSLEVTALAQHDQNDNYGSPVVQIESNGVPEILASLAGYPGTVRIGLDRNNAATSPSQPGQEQHEQLSLDKYSVTANWTVGGHTLTSITAYSRDIDGNISDADMLPGDYALRSVAESSRQFSQELRIVSPADWRFTYVAGALYLDSQLRNATGVSADYPFSPIPGVPLSGAETTHFKQNDDAVSAFGQGDFKLTKALRLSAGLRWTQESKAVDLDRVVTTPGLLTIASYPAYAPFSMRNTEANIDYSAGVEYAFNPNALAYVSYGKGTKSGGFAQSVSHLEDAPYKKEIAKTTEVGLKLQATNRTWVFNVAAFDTQVDGYQLVTFTGIQFNIGNTDLSSRGVEVETYWRPISGLKLFVNNTYADAQDRHTHEPIPLAPKWTGSAGFTYRAHLTDRFDWKADGSVDYRSKRYYQQDPATSPAGAPFTTLNLGLAVGAHNDAWELRLIGRNLTDSTVSFFAFPTPLLPPGNQSAIPERGRTVALQLSAKF